MLGWMLTGWVNAHGLNWRHNRLLWRICHHVGHETYYVIICLRFLRTLPHLTISPSRGHLRHLGLSGDDIKNLDKLATCCGWWCGCCHVCLRHHHCLNLQCTCRVLHVSSTEAVGCVPPSWLQQFVNHHLVLLNALHAVLYRFSDYAHHPARFIIFAQLAKLSIFLIIILIFPILFMFGTWKIAHTVPISIQHLLQCCVRLCCCQSCLVNVPPVVLLLHDRCLCILNSLSCHCGVSIHIILDPFVIFFVALKVRFP